MIVTQYPEGGGGGGLNGYEFFFIFLGFRDIKDVVLKLFDVEN